jgi:hypothetical protein
MPADADRPDEATTPEQLPTWAAAQLPPTAPPPLPTPPLQPPGRPHWSVVLAGALVVAALVAGAVFAFLPDDEGSSSADRREEEPSTTLPDEDPPDQSELEEVVAEISDFVEQERGLDFDEPVQVELEDDEGFEARLFDDFEEDAAELERYEPLYKAFGLVEPDGDLATDLRSAYSTGVVGFYDSETKELVVRGAALTPFVRVTIAHELTHALDDQHFDLDRPEYDDADDEVGLGFTALVEGMATVVEEAYLAELSDDEQEQYYDELGDIVAGGIPDVSMVLLNLISAPYSYGPDFVTVLEEELDRDGLDQVYEDPPHTSEQVADPQAYLDGEEAVEVPHPTADGTVVEDGVLGQLFVQELLTDSIVLDEAEDAADGWGGDWATSWTDGARSCVRFTMVGDSEQDTRELLLGWTNWADAVEQQGLAVDVEQPAAGQPLTVTSCTA